MTTQQANLILFDGPCDLCVWSVRFIRRHDKDAVFEFASIQSDMGRGIYRASGLDPKNPQSLLLLTNGRVLLRSDAAIEIARQFGGPWRLVTAFKVIPKVCRDWAYTFIVGYRYRRHEA